MDDLGLPLPELTWLRKTIVDLIVRSFTEGISGGSCSSGVTPAKRPCKRSRGREQGK
jgi:hypothetical protein